MSDGRDVADFLGADTLDRLEETQWLLALMRDVGECFSCNSSGSGSGSGSGSDLFMQHPLGRSVRLLYMNTLARVWYNFDSLQCFRARPIRSYRRLKADLETLTWTLVRETAHFLLDFSGSGSGSEEQARESVCTQYTSLLTRLNIM